MKRYIIPIIVFLFTVTNLCSQSGWYQLYNTGSNTYSLSFLNAETGFVTGYQKIFKTTDSGITWSNVFSTTTIYPYFIQFLDLDTGYALDAGHGVFIKTINSGLNWIQIPTGFGYGEGDFFFVDGNTGFLAYNYNILKTTNGGANWSSIYQYAAHMLSTIRFINFNTGFASGYGAVLRTTNQGVSWEVKSLNSSQDIIARFSVINENLIYGGGEYTQGTSHLARLYSSTNVGVDWVMMPTNSPYPLSNIWFTNSVTGYNCSYYNIYFTSNSGLTWSTQYGGNGAGNICFVNNLTGFATGFYILKTTTGGLTSAQLSSEEIPKAYILLQNYPNPFNPTTKIKFDVPSVGNGRDRSVRIIIYDVLGREVATLVNEQLKPGSYEVEWDGSNYASGIYFYQLVTEQFTETKRMVLIK